MKKLFVIFSLLTLVQSKYLSAQITLQHTLDSAYSGNWFYCTDIGNNDFKYVFLNATTNSFSLYNMDMSPYMTNIHIPVTSDSIAQGFTVIYITKTLFDCDSTNIEYAFEKANGGLNNPFRVFRTDGTLLLQVDSTNGPYCVGCYGGTHDIRPIINTSDGAKLFLQKLNNGTARILVYALCGVLPISSYDFSDQKPFVKVFPNPSANELNFEVVSPNNQEEVELVIWDSNGKEINRENINSVRNNYSLNVHNISNGTYMYSLTSKTRIYQTDKFIITK